MKRFVVSLAYNTLLLMGFLFLMPKVLLGIWRGRRSLDSLKQRLGFGLGSVKKGSRKLVWIHAVSLGETKAVTPLVHELRALLDNPIIVISSITSTGHAEAVAAMPFAEKHIYLPLDFSWIVRHLLRQITPDLVVITETDYWHHFLREARRQGAKLVVVNGKLSERSSKRYQRLPSLSREIFGLFDRICVQSEEYRERFVAIGVPSTQVIVTGNLKFDATFPALTENELASWRERLGIKPSDVVITAGSTHNPEERLILEACRILWERIPNLKLLIVPRHPERFEEVAALLQGSGIPFQRYNQKNKIEGTARVVLIDAMGVLKECYQLSSLAIVAGSFTKAVGGHNILEPCYYGVPTVFGPYMHSQPELERLVLKAHAGIQTDAEHLHAVIYSLISNPSLGQSYGKAGLELIAANSGAVRRTVAAITELVAAEPGSLQRQ